MKRLKSILKLLSDSRNKRLLGGLITLVGTSLGFAISEETGLLIGGGLILLGYSVAGDDTPSDAE